jgi:cell fate (sporulation/competence/biofilm development) regulator YlbF (YheA/YmcA/DUF963 family)
MLSWFRPDPKKKLRRAYERLQRRAMDVQRSGDVVAAAKLYDEAAQLWKQIEGADG